MANLSWFSNDMPPGHFKAIFVRSWGISYPCGCKIGPWTFPIITHGCGKPYIFWILRTRGIHWFNFKHKAIWNLTQAVLTVISPTTGQLADNLISTAFPKVLHKEGGEWCYGRAHNKEMPITLQAYRIESEDDFRMQLIITWLGGKLPLEQSIPLNCMGKIWFVSLFCFVLICNIYLNIESLLKMIKVKLVHLLQLYYISLATNVYTYSE